jgi:homoserine O-acetyltransferase/O-succinyltransferase
MSPCSQTLRALRTLFCAAAAGVAAVAAYAQHEGVYTIARFEFEAGGVLDNMKVGYVTYGARAPDDSNVIVLLPPTSGLKSWAAAHIGPGKTFDTDWQFIVSIDAIGGGTSSQPRDGLSTRFPAYNIRDMVRAQHELLTRGLGIRRALAVGGASSGAYQALEWGILYPDFPRGLLLYAGAAQADRHVKVIVDGIVGTLSLDPAFATGQVAAPGGEAVRRASTVYFPWLVSDRMLESLGSDEELAKAEASFGDNWVKNWDAVGLAWRYKSSRLHDVAAPFGGRLNEALARVTAAVLVLPVTSDRTHPIEMSESMSKSLTKARVSYAPLDSVRGHVAVFRPPGTPEYAFVSEQTRHFLAGLR